MNYQPSEMIDPKKQYSMLEIVALGVLGKSHRTVTMVILKDKYARNLLKADIVQNGKGSRYKIKGSQLIKYIHARLD